MRVIYISIITLLSLKTVSGQINSEAMFIGGESMLDVYLKKYLSKDFEDVKLVCDIRIDQNGKAQSPKLIAPDNMELQKALEYLVLKMPSWTPAKKQGLEVSSTKRIECWLEGEVVQDIDHAPSYPGGAIPFYNFIESNIQNPQKGTYAEVSIRFVVDRNGQIRHPKVFRSYDEEHNIEALRLVGLIEEMIPAEKNGKKVNSYYTFTIYFR